MLLVTDRSRPSSQEGTRANKAAPLSAHGTKKRLTTSRRRGIQRCCAAGVALHCTFILALLSRLA